MSLATKPALTRGRVAKLTGCNSETIRYYERVGLLPEPERGTNGYRRYNQDQVSRLHFINRAKQLGFSNEDIAELLEIARGPGTHTRAEVKSLTETHIQSIRERIEELQKMEQTLTRIATQCDGSSGEVNHCPILLSLFDGNIEATT